MEPDHSKINKSVRKNSSLTSAGLQLGVAPEIMELYYPLLIAANKYYKNNSNENLLEVVVLLGQRYWEIKCDELKRLKEKPR